MINFRSFPLKQFCLLVIIFQFSLAFTANVIKAQDSFSKDAGIGTADVYNQIKIKAENEIAFKKEILANFIKQIENEVSALANNEFTRSYANQNTPSNKKSLTQLFNIVASADDRFMQIRFLDALGWEKVRVDRLEGQSKPVIVKEKDLQNKGGRSYFLSIKKTLNQQLWHSRFDLNMERGKVEIPLKPTFRVGTPIYSDGIFKGIVIINLRLEPLLKLLRNSIDFNVYLIDHDGKYIIHPNPDQEWSRFFPERGEILDAFPKLGHQLLKQKKFENGLFSDSLSKNLRNNETIKLILDPKKEMLIRFQDTSRLSGERVRLKKDLGLNSQETEFLGKHPVIRVHNEMDWPPFNYYEDNQPKGLSIDYMRLLAQKIGIEVEFISGHSWNEYLEMLKRKELDVVLNVVRTPKRLKYALFTQPYILNPNIIVSQSKDKFESMQDLYGKTVSFPKGFFYEEVLTNNYPQIIRFAVKSTLDSLEAVVSGKADAAIGENAVTNYLLSKHHLKDLSVSGEVTIGNPDLVNLRLGIRKDWQLLRSILDKAMKKITDQEMIHLRQKWLSTGILSSTKLSLTGDEQNWLVRHPVMRLGDDFSWPPFSFVDSEGRYAGVSSGYIDLVSERLGIQLIPKIGMTWSEVLDKIKNKEIDILPALAKTPEREKFINFTKPYVAYPIVITTRKDYRTITSLSDLDGVRVGVVKNYITEDIMIENHPDAKMVGFKNLAEGLRALNEKKIDAFIDNLVTITWEIDQANLENLKIAAPTDYKFELAMGVRKDWPKFIPILEKAIDTISKEERAAIENTWTSINLEFGWKLSDILIYAIPIGLTGSFILIFVVVWNQRLAHEISERKRIETALNESHEKITDSIQFASMIQNALLPDGKLMPNFFKDGFVIWEPKDVVAGDIYFFEKLRNEDEFLLFIIDCTGHGVPGALVTALVKAVQLQVTGEALKTKGEINSARILTFFNIKLKHLLKQEHEKSLSNVGFDGGVLYCDKKRKIARYAGAETPLFYIQNGKLTMLKGDRQSIGYRNSETYYAFKEHTIDVNQNTCFYLTTDGFLDQMGGEKGYPYGKKRFKQLIRAHHQKEFSVQKELYLEAIKQYRGEGEATDDMTLVGVKID